MPYKPEYEPLYCNRCKAIAVYLDYQTSMLRVIPTLCTACYDQQKRMGQ